MLYSPDRFGRETSEAGKYTGKSLPVQLAVDRLVTLLVTIFAARKNFFTNSIKFIEL